MALALVLGSAFAWPAQELSPVQPVLAEEAKPTSAAAPDQQKPANGTAKRTPPQIAAVCVETPPVIDGKLDDACWTKASRLEGFFPPDVAEPNPEETIGLVCVDKQAIYVGVICKDRTPDDIKGVETRRNGSLWEDDTVEFYLDPWNQHQEAYSFRLNARGTQAEDIPGGSATKIEWRGDWKGAAVRTAEGWTAEMEIPFSILRYPPGQTTFGFLLSRHFAKERLWVLHPITGGKSFDFSLADDLIGLRPPPYKPRPIFMPYVTLDFGDAIGKRRNAGLDVQYRMANGLTALGVIRPDFKQIEDVVEPISFSYTEKYLADPRPFFQTGQGYLPGEMMLYTRRIEEFDAGGKLYGTIGNESIGLLDASRLGEENALAAQWRHVFNKDSDIALKAVSHTLEGEPNNTVIGVDTFRRWRRPKGDDGLGLSYRAARTEGVEAGALYEAFGFHFRGSGEPNWDWNLRRVTPEFEPRLGYYYDQNSVGGRFRYGKWTHYEKGAVEWQGWDVNTEYFPRIDKNAFDEDGEPLGPVLRTGISPGYNVSFRNGRSIGFGLTRGRERGFDNSEARLNYGWNNSDIYRRGGAFVLRGTRAGGDYSYYTLDQGFRPLKALSVNLHGEYSHLEPPSPDAEHVYQAVVTLAYDLTTEKCISARVITRDAGTTVFLAYRQVVRRGMDAYVLVGDPDPDRTGFTKRAAVKLIWAF